MLRATVAPIGLRPDFVPDAGVEALDLHTFRRFMVAQGGEFQMGDQWPRAEDLLASAVVEEISGTLRPTLYGLMVFGRDPQRYGTTADLYTECAAYGGSERSGETVAAAASIRGPLGEQVVRSLDWFRDLLLPGRFATGERNDEPLLPPEVLREALVNALVHRDYAIMGRQVLLEVFRDRVEVTSPGGLLGRMTVERVRGGGAPRSRNEAMANAMVVSGLTGRRGTGWLDLRRRMREFNGTEPELAIETGTEGPFTRVTLRLDRV